MKTARYMMLVMIAVPALAADKYLDLNGTAAGFGLNNAAGFITVDPTTTNWNSDAAGGSNGTFSVLSAGDTTHFMLSGTSDVNFNWENYAGIPLGGIVTDIESGSPWIGRMQKPGGGAEALTWSSGAVVETRVPNGFWWDFATSGDFTKTGSSWLRFGDGQPKVDGVCTISNGYVVLRQLSTVSASSSFRMTANDQVRIVTSLSGTATLGKLIGAGSITRDGGSGNILGVTIGSTGVVLTNGVAGDTFTFKFGCALSLAANAVTELDISKNGGTPTADTIKTGWAQQPLGLAGSLNVILLPGSEAPALGDEFRLFDGGLAGGAFSYVSLPNISGDGVGWDVTRLETEGILSVTTAPKYLDLNGATPGFGLTSTNGNGDAANEVQFDYSQGTNWAWTTDASGVSGHGPLLDGETAHFRLSGDGNILFEFLPTINDSGVRLGGIQVSREPGSTVVINRYQQDNEGGGAPVINWAPGAVVDTSELNYGFWWDLGTTNDYTKTGSRQLEFGDGNRKVSGTLTIARGTVRLRRTTTVDTSSSFHLAGGELALHAHVSNDNTFRDVTKSIGTISGSGKLVSSGEALTNTVLLLEGGIDMSSSNAFDTIEAGFGLSLALGAGASTVLDISRFGGVTTQDVIRIDWPDKSLTVDGELNVNLIPGSEPLERLDTFKILDAGTIAGTFTSLSLPTFSDDSFYWDTSKLYTEGTIVAMDAPGLVIVIR